MLDERDIFDINRSVGASEKMFSVNFSKAKTKFCLSLDYNHDNTCLFVNGKNFFLSFKPIIKY